MALPPLTPDQRRAALEKAAAARQVRAEIKRRLKSSSATLADVLGEASRDEVVAKLKVVDLLRAMPGVGAATATEIMERVGIAPTRRIRGLGAHQQQALLDEFASRG